MAKYQTTSTNILNFVGIEGSESSMQTYITNNVSLDERWIRVTKNRPYKVQIYLADEGEWSDIIIVREREYPTFKNQHLVPYISMWPKKGKKISRDDRYSRDYMSSSQPVSLE